MEQGIDGFVKKSMERGGKRKMENGKERRQEGRQDG
jgi:hypothetical protein